MTKIKGRVSRLGAGASYNVNYSISFNTDDSIGKVNDSLRKRVDISLAFLSYFFSIFLFFVSTTCISVVYIDLAKPKSGAPRPELTQDKREF